MVVFSEEMVYQEYTGLIEDVPHDPQHPDHFPLAEVEVCNLGILELSVTLHLKDLLVDFADLLGVARL